MLLINQVYQTHTLFLSKIKKSFKKYICLEYFEYTQLPTLPPPHLIHSKNSNEKSLIIREIVHI